MADKAFCIRLPVQTCRLDVIILVTGVVGPDDEGLSALRGTACLALAIAMQKNERKGALLRPFFSLFRRSLASRCLIHCVSVMDIFSRHQSPEPRGNSAGGFDNAAEVESAQNDSEVQSCFKLFESGRQLPKGQTAVD